MSPSPGTVVLLALRSLLAMVLAFAVVVLVNQAGGELGDFAGFSGGGDARLAWDMGWVLVANVLAAWIAVRLAPCAPRGHAFAFFLLLLAIAVYAVVQLGGDWPRWFSAGIVLTLPLQVWLGAYRALGGKRRQ